MLDSSVFNTENTYDIGNGSLFLQQERGLSDTINRPYPELNRLYKLMRNNNWDENEWPFDSCIQEFESAPKVEYEMMIETLAWQWEADSTAVNNIAPVVAPFVSNSDLWDLWLEISRNECITGDHEVLTPKGWKPIDQVSTQDLVAQWNYETLEVDFVKPERVIIEHHEGKLYLFEDQKSSISQITTPKHRMPVYYPHESNIEKPQFTLAQDVIYHTDNALPTAGYLKKTDRHLSTKEKLFIAVQAEGSINPDPYSESQDGFNTYSYRFDLEDDRKIERLHELCEELNWQIIEDTADSSLERGFVISVPLDQYRDDVQTFDWFDLDEIGSQWAMDFLKEIKNWGDTSVYDHNKIYATTNSACADKVNTIAHLCGYSGMITVEVDEETGGAIYQVSVCERVYARGDTISKTEIENDCLVYCLVVPTSYFLVRHQGCISVTGNCVHSRTYSEIVKGSFVDPKTVMNEILKVKEAHSRMEPIVRVMTQTKKVGAMLTLKQMQRNDPLARDTIMLFTVAMLALERIQFMSSFPVTFAFAEADRYMNVALAVQKIANDELNVHAVADKEILRIELGTAIGRESWSRIKSTAQELVDSVVKAELSWAGHLFRDGRQLPGCTYRTVSDGIHYAATDVYDFLGLDNPGKVIRKQPIEYMDDWTNLNKSQGSPQEHKTGNYLIGGVKNSLGGKVLSEDI